MGRRAEEKKERARRALAHWYSIQPLSLLPVGAYLLAILLSPVARGETVTWESVSGPLQQWALLLGAALLVAWLFWRAGRRSDRLANIVFAGVVVIAGVWSAGLNPTQRAEATQMLRQTAGEQLSRVTEQVFSERD